MKKKTVKKLAPKQAVQPAATITLPQLRAGEHYAGIVLKEDGTPDYHLIGLLGKFKGTWDAAMAWAKKQGGDLPNRRDLGLERVNARQHFEDAWYWSNEQNESLPDYAWCQYFSYGDQNYNRKDGSLRARAVRRLPI